MRGAENYYSSFMPAVIRGVARVGPRAAERIGAGVREQWLRKQVEITAAARDNHRTDPADQRAARWIHADGVNGPSSLARSKSVSES
jgi:hypothetical protein